MNDHGCVVLTTVGGCQAGQGASEVLIRHSLYHAFGGLACAKVGTRMSSLFSERMDYRTRIQSHPVHPRNSYYRRDHMSVL